MNNASTSHISVLKQEVLDYLNPSYGDWIVDATLGLSGHAKLILEKIGPQGMLIGIDQDKESIETAKAALKNFKNTVFVRDNFEFLPEILEDVYKLLAARHEINGILFDLGLSSMHLSDASRGFSFQASGPLDMRFDKRQKLTAADIVNKYSLKDLIFIFKTYGEERYSKLIAEKIVGERKKRKILTTIDLKDLILSVARKKERIHPATRVFQALRIAVNRELEVLEKALEQAVNLVALNGRLVVISFHSLEDRIVKTIFKTYSLSNISPKLKLPFKKPITPSGAEISMNPRARSAKLRAAVRIL